MRLTVAGGGITGLTAVYLLAEARRSGQWQGEIDLVEPDSQLGGKIRTVHEDGFVVEGGPDALLSFKPEGVGLVRELGLGDELVAPCGRGVHLLKAGRLRRIPEDFLRLSPGRIWTLMTAPCLPLTGKLRAALEPLVPPRRSEADEAVGSFLRRRLGSAFAKQIGEPFMAGIHAGDPDRLSMQALYPTYAEMERRHGSLTKGMVATQRRSSSGAAPFVTLDRGLGSLVERLESRLDGVNVLRGRAVSGVAVTTVGGSRRYAVRIDDGASIVADRVIVAAPAAAAAPWLDEIASEAAGLLRRLTFRSTGVVTLALDRSSVAQPLDTNGFLVPSSERYPLSACTWTSSKWPGRAPASAVLVRAFIGGANGDDLLDADDDVVVARTVDALRPVLGLAGFPRRVWVHRWPDAMPQYAVGHLDWVAALDRALTAHPGIVLAGSSYRGVGIPDCVRQAKEAVTRILSSGNGPGPTADAPKPGEQLVTTQA
ncbi:MAG: protoporphyrinogen oxidase [Chloroflexi bacterium]|nr:protoporphyrinogen oxidase [Chloroflexota bacterium]